MSEKFSGSCLCGATAFEGEGTPVRFYHCYCGRCRKVSGAAHASNVFFKADSFRFTKGEELLRFYKVPEAERFANRFCSRCGSRSAREVPGGEIVMVPAGALDNEPSLKPMARIFWTSRSEWSYDEHELPAFEEYPN